MVTVNDNCNDVKSTCSILARSVTAYSVSAGSLRSNLRWRLGCLQLPYITNQVDYYQTPASAVYSLIVHEQRSAIQRCLYNSTADNNLSHVNSTDSLPSHRTLSRPKRCQTVHRGNPGPVENGRSYSRSRPCPSTTETSSSPTVLIRAQWARM
jgi:hypothetical protein